MSSIGQLSVKSQKDHFVLSNKSLSSIGNTDCHFHEDIQIKDIEIAWVFDMNVSSIIDFVRNANVTSSQPMEMDAKKKSTVKAAIGK